MMGGRFRLDVAALFSGASSLDGEGKSKLTCARVVVEEEEEEVGGDASAAEGPAAAAEADAAAELPGAGDEERSGVPGGVGL
jgi:hypothetical protein